MMSRNSYSLRLSPDDYTALRLYVVLAGSTSMNHIVRQAVKNFLRAPRTLPIDDRAEHHQPRARIPLRLPDDEHQPLASYAKHMGVSMNVVAAHAVHLFLAEPGRAAMLAHALKARRERGS